MERLKQLAVGFVGTALCLALWDYWLLRQRINEVALWANAVAPTIARIQQADVRNAQTAQEVHQPPKAAK